MKRFGLPFLLLVILGIMIYKIDDISDYAANLVSARPIVTIEDANEYKSENDYLFVQKSTDFVPYSKQDIINIFYSIFNNGYETFTFYCPTEYTECRDDVEEITGNQNTITHIGNFVHPFNNFTNLKVVTDSLGEVDVIVTKMYDSTKIDAINTKLDEIFREIFTEGMDINDKILKIHDYIIDHAYYDLDESENSGNAYGALIEGKCKCSGYADAMAIALSKLGIKNYKVASEKHVWNALYLDGEWSQIDLTWDDPVVENGATITDTIRHKFYMVDTPTLMSYDTLEHNFDKTVYLEVK